MNKGAARSCQDDLFQVGFTAAGNTLKDGAVLAVDRQDLYPVFLGFFHNNITGHDQSFLVSQRDVYTLIDGSQRRHQTRSANHCGNNHIDGRLCCCSDIAFFSIHDPDLASGGKPIFEVLGSLFIIYHR